MKISFLLGAGCENGGQLGLPSGNSFKRDTIMAKDAEEFFLKINKASSKIKLNKRCFLTANSTNVLYQTIKEYGEGIFSFDANARGIIQQYLAYKNDGKDLSGKVLSQKEKDTIKAAFQDLYKTQFYDEIVSGKSVLSNNAETLLDKACFYEAVDSLFNYLRKPDSYPTEVGRVIKLYCSAYLSVVRSIIEDVEYANFFKTKMDVSDARRKFVELLRAGMSRVASQHDKKTGIYYNQIKSLINQPDVDVTIVTANYTDFVKDMTGLSNEKIAYVHGKLNLFENVYTKKIDSLDSFEDEEIVFPHIFIQSGIKPIVSASQIVELYKAKASILESDVLIILGYGVNSDDEHLSNLLRERLRDNKRIDYFLYGSNNSITEKDRIKKELFSNALGINFHDATDFETFLNGLK